MPKTQTRAPATQVAVVEPTALQAIQRAEIDSTIATAKMYPRDMQAALDRVQQMATLTEAIAEECHYSLPKTDKNGRKINIQGPSVRFAEILASQWGNLRIASRIIEIGAKQIVAQGVCLDLESNVANDIEVRRSILKKNGERYSEDVVTTNANAAAAVGWRNAVLKTVPKPLWNPIYEATLKRIGSDKMPLAERWQKTVAWFGSRGVPEQTLRDKIGIKKPSDLTQKRYQELVGWRNAIEEDPTAIEEIFGIGDAQNEESEKSAEVSGAARREPPTEVTASEPAEETKDAPGTEPDSEEARRATAKLFTEWREMRKSLSGEEVDEVRKFAGVGLIDTRCSLAQLEAVIRKASEIAEGKRE